MPLVRLKGVKKQQKVHKYTLSAIYLSLFSFLYFYQTRKMKKSVEEYVFLQRRKLSEAFSCSQLRAT